MAKSFVGGGGLIFRAAANTALPTGQSGAIPTDSALTAAGFVELGTVSSDGLQFSPSRETKEITDWAGNSIRTIYSGHTEEFKFSLVDFVEANSLKAAFGDGAVTTTAATSSHGTINKTVFNAQINTAAAWVFLMQDGEQIVCVYAPQCEISGWDSISFVSEDIAKHTLTAKATKGTSNNTVEIYTDNGEKAA